MWLVIIIFLSGALFAVLSFDLLLKRRILLAGINGMTGISLLAISTALLLIFLNINTYSRLTGEVELARIVVGHAETNGTPLTLLQSDNKYSFLIKEEEWQLDARFLKWKPWAHLLGKDPVVRLERISGRNPRAAHTPNSVHDLLEQDEILSRMGSMLSDWIGIVDTYYGSSVYMPAEEGAVYVVTASLSGLVARPENIYAEQAVQKWMSP